MVIQNMATTGNEGQPKAALAAPLCGAVQSAHAPITVKCNRATPARRRNRLEPVPRASTVSGRQTVSGSGLLAAMLGAALAISIILAPPAAARGAEGGQVCTGPQNPTNSCHPRALQQVPLGDQMPEGCKPTGPGTKACGRATSHGR
jgi:hypothetical protein